MFKKKMFLDRNHELTDHLGNVRVTFKKNTDNTLSVLSKADYYAFGGQLPGRIWQQSGGEYRYGYQGQEKSMDESTWDNFELRNFNHDLGRWSAPDPYAQFHSPYLAMANNPVNNIDPNGGYMVASDEGMVQRNKFIQKWQEYVISDAGQRFIRSNYQRDYEELARKILTGYTDELMGLAQKDGGRFLEALLQLNNDYLGMGLSAIYLNSGTDRVVGGAILKNKKLVEKLQGMNGEAQRVADMQNVVDQYHRPLNIIDAAEQDFVNENNRRQREYVNEWRTGEQAAFIAALQGLMSIINAPKDLDNPSFMNPGQQPDTSPLAATTYTDPPGGKSKKNMVRDNKMRKHNPRYSGGHKRYKRTKKDSDKIKFWTAVSINNFVLWDIRFRANLVPESEKFNKYDYPGRIWGFKNENFKFSLFYVNWKAIKW